MPVINNEYDHIEYLDIALGTSSKLLNEDAKLLAVSQALTELKYTYPLDKPMEQLWAIKRGMRHALDILRVESAHRFKYKQLSLNHRFNHYNELIGTLDKEFEDSFPELSGYMHSFYIESGFVYDRFGNDVTKAMNNLFG